MKQTIIEVIKAINVSNIDNSLWEIHDKELAKAYYAGSDCLTTLPPHISVYSDAEIGEDLENKCDMKIETEWGTIFIFEF